ncbi:MAG TPA: lipoyl(octanoyl) transferase LipB [Terriglobales bacterium]
MISLLQLGQLDYATALDLQRSLVGFRKQGRISDTLLLLEHPPVITMGRNSKQQNLIASPELLRQKGVELHESDRGGDVTFHGPGQLVGYPIFDLRGFTPRLGAVDYVRRVEEVLIRTCGDLGIPCERIAGLTGVWTQPADLHRSGKTVSQQRKIAAIGVHISRGVTSHGFALNVTTDLDYFKLIVPCGISDRPVTSITHECEVLQRPIPSMEAVRNAVSLNFGRVFHDQVLWLESLDQLLHTGNHSPDLPDNKKAPEADTIDVPLKVPRELREIRRNPNGPTGSYQDGVDALIDNDELFLA